MSQLDRAIGWSTAKPGQPDNRNADHFSTLVHPNNARVALHVVCDGVSAAQHGRAAARTACDHVIQRFRDIWTTDVVDADFLRDTLIDAHDFVRRSVATSKAHCTIVSALVNLATETLTIGHAGDSVAFRYDGNQLVQLTEDHVEAEVQLENGKPILVNSSPVIVRALVRYVGQSGTFDPEIATHSFALGSWICLATDGVQRASIQRLFADIAVATSQESLSEFCRACSVESNDDATVLVQQLGRRAEIDKLETQLQGYKELDAQGRDRLIVLIESNRDVNPDLVFAC